MFITLRLKTFLRLVPCTALATLVVASLGYSLPALGAGTRAERALFLEYQPMLGEPTGSFVGAYGYGLTLLTRAGSKVIRFTTGLSLSYISGQASLEGMAYSATSYGGELYFGLAFKPLPSQKITPVLELKSSIGAQFLETSSSYSKPFSASPTFGVVGSFGLKIGLESAFYTGVQYHLKRALLLGGVSSFVLDHFSFFVGTSF